jgi:hypothetical protein
MREKWLCNAKTLMAFVNSVQIAAAAAAMCLNRDRVCVQILWVGWRQVPVLARKQACAPERW